MAGDPMEEVAKRMQGLKDSRGPVGMMARGKNMYPGGNAAQSGPGGPDMGRPANPTAVPQAAMDAVLQRTGQTPPPGSLGAANPMAEKLAAEKVKKGPQMAQAAMKAAAQRKMNRGR